MLLSALWHILILSWSAAAFSHFAQTVFQRQLDCHKGPNVKAGMVLNPSLKLDKTDGEIGWMGE